MALTRAAVEAELIGRTADMMALFTFDTEPSGANADLAGPIAFGVRACGLTVADIASGPSDSELGAVAAGDTDKLLDCAEYRLLVNMRNRWTKVRHQMGATTIVYWEQIRDSLAAWAKQAEARLDAKYLLNVGTLTAGVIVADTVEVDPAQVAEF